MMTSRTTTTTINNPIAITSSRPADPPSPGAPIDDEEDIIMREALARVERVKAWKAEEAAKNKAAEEAEEEERRRQAAATRHQAAQDARDRAVATARSHRGTSTGETSASPRRPIVEIPRVKSKGKGKARAQPVGEDPNDGDDDDEEREPLKREGGFNPTGERLAVLESQMAQLLADNRQLREGQVKANTYHCHFNKKLDWLMIDAARRRRLPPEMLEARPSRLSRKCRRVVDSDEEEEEEEQEEEEEEEGEGEVPAPKKTKTAASEKGKEKEVE
ncbi:hypothetical protein EV359DRAFT_87040 [Lentinula novae-zelandiae]|nr:hypothetical protein EV359DRAFT_87040 [Lentinula novae-zelandiae]